MNDSFGIKCTYERNKMIEGNHWWTDSPLCHMPRRLMLDYSASTEQFCICHTISRPFIDQRLVFFVCHIFWAVHITVLYTGQLILDQKFLAGGSIPIDSCKAINRNGALYFKYTNACNENKYIDFIQYIEFTFAFPFRPNSTRLALFVFRSRCYVTFRHRGFSVIQFSQNNGTPWPLKNQNTN